tara:strand:+ start:2658 stop:3248 length:591 start_codon:yes stop_codon:yes gene_type:complete
MKKGIYKNIRLQQNIYVVEKIKDIIACIKPSRIIEIGTGRAGLTLLLSDILEELELKNSKIKSFDITMREHVKCIYKDNLEFYLGNIFNYVERLVHKPEEITNFISKEGINLILCDGGNKVVEFNSLAKYLNQGDIIMAHDYAPNKEVFDTEYVDKIWNWMEIADKDIEQSVINYNLVDYKSHLIKPTAWVAKIKT